MFVCVCVLLVHGLGDSCPIAACVCVRRLMTDDACVARNMFQWRSLYILMHAAAAVFMD